MRIGLVLVAVIAIGCGPSGRNSDGACTAGQMKCNGLVLETCVGGQFNASQTCTEACSETIGCAACAPGTATCNGEIAHACKDDGTGFVDQDCDPAEGMTCDPMQGGCTGPCAPHNLGTSYIGCDYYPTVTGNTVGETFDFAVAIANTTATPAMVTIDGGALGTPVELTVPADSVAVQTLPWVDALKLCSSPDTDGCEISGQPLGTGALASGGAYHVRSTSPVTLYQFNSLEYTKGGVFSYSNDASLLLPTNTWRTTYYAAAFQPLAGVGYPSELAVTAMQDSTMVTINAKAPTVAGSGAPAFTPNMPQSVMLSKGDVLELTSSTGDLTGSSIMSDKPVSVISGHFCADVPDGITACDHLEESMFPVDTLGFNYVVNAPAVTSIPSGKVELIRVIATSANTNLTYNPPQPGAPATIANAGDFVEIQNNANSFEITADQKVMVAQYMEGQDAGGGTGDPAMALAVPVEQFRTDYLFHAPTEYESNYVDVTAVMGATVTLDGMALTFTPIGTTGYGLARVYPLTAGPGGDGNHSIQGDMPFGITVYGYGQYTSYWYPGGLDLNDVIN